MEGFEPSRALRLTGLANLRTGPLCDISFHPIVPKSLEMRVSIAVLLIVPMATIKHIHAYEIFDSRGFPTIEAKMVLDNGVLVITSIPAGTSTGKYEAHELRDGDERFGGLGVNKAINIINTIIAPRLIGANPMNQQEIDEWLIHKVDGTSNKAKIGANVILTISQLCAKAAAKSNGIQLFNYINYLYNNRFPTEKINIQKIPTAAFCLINGGKHAYNTLDFQEFLIIPTSNLNFASSYQLAAELFHELKEVLVYRNASVSFGEEGGYCPNFSSNLDALEIMKETCTRKNLVVGTDIFLGMDVAASILFKQGKYYLKDKPQGLSSHEFTKYLENIIHNYSLMFLEDPFEDDSWQEWSEMNKENGDKIYIIGDDLITANKARLENATAHKACNTILIKPNQIGSISESLDVIHYAKQNNISVVVSHRSGETNDDFIADFAVGVQSDFMKFGATNRGERVAKYNRLLVIENEELKIG